MIRLIHSEFDSKTWDECAPNPMQSWAWGEARSAMGLTVVRIGEFDKTETLKKVFQFTIHPIPKTPYSIGYLPRSEAPSKAVLDFLYEFGKKNKLIFIKIEPYEVVIPSETEESRLDVTEIPWIPDQVRNDMEYKLQISPHPLFPPWTQMLDLNKSEEELLAQMHPKTRYNARLAAKKGVVIKEMSTQEGFEIFSKLYFETCKRQNYHGHTKKYHQTVWETLYKAGIAKILVAFYENTPLATYELFIFNNRIYYVYGGSSEAHKNVMAPNLLMWEAIKLGKTLGCEQFDMWGSLPPNYDARNKWAGFTRFKQGYGTEFVEFVGSFDLVINQPLYPIYNLLHTIRKYILRFI